MVRNYRCSSAWALLVVIAHQDASAAQAPAARSPEVLEFMRCRDVSDPAVRLACFDRAAAALDRAVGEGELIVVPKARKSHFGVPDNGTDLLGGKEPVEIRGVIRSARGTADGWLVTLEDGSTWQQIEAVASVIDPRTGLAVTIKRGALGSYRLVLSPHAAFKVRRVR
jgi:hypothetical protein